MQKQSNGFLAYGLILTLLGSIFSIGLAFVFSPVYASHMNITVEIDDISYGQGDEVTITGSVDEPTDDDEPVTIKVRRPSGAVDDQDDVQLSSQDEFDFIYSVSGNAADGIYTVEVEYDNDKVYSFFLVDEEDDTILVELDEATYQGGDDVEIFGEVEDPDLDQADEVEITIIDPTNTEILDAEGVEVEIDEFNFTFDDLGSNAAHGRYAVIVTYDVDNQEGFGIFEVEDDGNDSSNNNDDEGDSGDNGQISAQVEARTYEPGDTVEVTGEIDTLISGVEEVEFVVEGPDADEIEDDDAPVESNGDFTIEFVLLDDAEEGDYTITITYDNDDDLELEFTVEEGSGGSSGGSSSSSVTVRLDKTSHLAGERITVTGTVSKVVADQDIAVAVYKPDATWAGSIAYVTPNSDKTYTATLILKSDLEEDEDYVVKVDYAGSAASARFSITGVSSGGGSDTLNVKTDKTTYAVGSTVTISGNIAAGSTVSGSQVLIQVLTPEDAPCRIDPVDVEDDGSYSYSLATGGKCGLVGEYEVIATFNQKQVKTAFELLSSSGRAAYNLKVEEKVYPIEYEISSGTIKSMFVKPSEKKLVVTLDSPQQEGQITLVLPRDVIDSVQDGRDIGFLVSTTDIEAGAGGSADVSESNSGDNKTRTIVVQYQGGTDLIEISGTAVVPEFGPIAAVLLAVAIMGTILVTSRLGTRFNIGLK